MPKAKKQLSQPSAWATTGPSNQKRRGEIAEAAFLAKASSMGFGVAKPWGDSDRYDFIVDVHGRLLRVQIKSSHCVRANAGGGYHMNADSRSRRPYTPDEIDLLVGYIVPEDIWYVFPPCAFQTMKSMRLFPHEKQKVSKFNQYREDWHWFHETPAPPSDKRQPGGKGTASAVP